MKSDRRSPVAIIGGGFSGTMVAAQLARRGIVSVIVEGAGRVGQGVAYSTTEVPHLLNVRADNMSAWPDDPQHFARTSILPGGDPKGFAQRRLYGEYLARILSDAVATGLVTVTAEPAVSANREDSGWRIELADGTELEAETLVLATGNQPPERLGETRSDGSRYIDNPWSEASKAAIAEVAREGGDVLIVGTGLTMVDLVLSLDAVGHTGRIVALSRRGLIPRAHADFEAAPVELSEVPHGGVRALTRWLRRRSGEVGWRAAVDSLRPHAHRLWQALDTEQQRRFLRHARPWWDVHRHRIAPEVARRVKDLIAADRLEIVAGRIRAMTEAEDAIDVAILRRGACGETTRRFAYVFNCTGPLGTIGRTRDPLLRSLLDGGSIKPDKLGIGIAVDDRSRAAGTDRLWALGPLTKGRYWEIVAVPDIRNQAAEVADDIARELNR